MALEIQKKQQMGKVQEAEQSIVYETVYVDRFIDGILDPNHPMLGPVRDGGHIVANTAPGCWGPMITPEIRGGPRSNTADRG